MSESLLEHVQQWSSVEDGSSKLCRFFAVLVSYCCKIPERKDMSTVLPGICVPRPILRCLSVVGGILPLQCREAHELRDESGRNIREG